MIAMIADENLDNIMLAQELRGQSDPDMEVILPPARTTRPR